MRLDMGASIHRLGLDGRLMGFLVKGQIEHLRPAADLAVLDEALRQTACDVHRREALLAAISAEVDASRIQVGLTWRPFGRSLPLSLEAFLDCFVQQHFHEGLVGNVFLVRQDLQ